MPTRKRVRLLSRATRTDGSLILLALVEIIVFSDGLDIPRCVNLQKRCGEAGVGCSFGVGTFFTNGECLTQTLFRRLLTVVPSVADYKTVPNPDKANLDGSGELSQTGTPSKALNMVTDFSQ